MSDSSQQNAWSREWRYPSNILSCLRLVMVLPIVYSLLKPEKQRQAAFWLASAMLTDALDGPIARARGEVSKLGQLLDPIADKVIIDLSSIILAKRGRFPWWMVGLLLFRDAGITVCGLMVLGKHSEVTLSKWTGKSATVGISIALLLYLLEQNRLAQLVLAVALLPFTLSFFHYSQQFLEMYRSPAKS